jgi:integrase
LISSILSTAVQWQVIPENPAKRVKPPKVQKQKAPAYDEMQTANLLKTLKTVGFTVQGHCYSWRSPWSQAW